jgi:hypothetical protein
MANVANQLHRMGRSQFSGHVVYLYLRLRLDTIANICTVLTFSGESGKQNTYMRDHGD